MPAASVDIRPLAFEDAAALLALRVRNRSFLEPWEPARPEGFYSLAAQAALVADSVRAWEQGRSYRFGIVAGGELVGGVSLNDVVRGVFQSAHLGYWLDEAHGGRGIATAAVRLAVAYAFGEAGLHRVQAAVIPRNAASLRVVEKAGFREEGLALRYLRIAGVWEDHRLFAITAEEAREPSHPSLHGLTP